MVSVETIVFDEVRTGDGALSDFSITVDISNDHYKSCYTKIMRMTIHSLILLDSNSSGMKSQRFNG